MVNGDQVASVGTSPEGVQILYVGFVWLGTQQFSHYCCWVNCHSNTRLVISVCHAKLIYLNNIGCVEKIVAILLHSHAFAQMVGRVVYCWMKIYFVAWFGFLGTRRIDARWTAPVRLNGVLERFLLYISSSLSESPGDVVYNSTDIGFLTYRNDTLNAGTTYYVTLGVCVNVYLGYSCVVFIWIWIMLQISTISLIATTSAMRGLSTVYNKNCSFFLNSLIQMSVNRINFHTSCFIRQIIILHCT